jgi:hypothetical protein
MRTEDNETLASWFGSFKYLASPPQIPHQSNGEEVENLDDAQDAAAHEEARYAPEGHCQHSTTECSVT